MRELNLLFLVPGLGGGGAEMNAARLSAPLFDNGIRCSYACLSNANDYLGETHADSTIFFLNAKPSSSSTARAIQSVRPLSKLLKQQEFDVIVAVTDGPFLTMALMRALGHTKTLPTLLSVQNAAIRSGLQERGIIGRIKFRFWRAVHSQADGAIALTKGVANDLEQAVPLLKNRVRMVHNVGSPLTEAREPGTCSSCDKPFRIVACGRLVPIKGYPDMLRAVAKTARYHDIRLDILGTGPLERELYELATQLGIGDRVVFHGFVPVPAAIMREADLFLLSSHSEGFGNVIVEAMALGIPVIATDCPYGPGEIITHGESGLLVPVGDWRALSDGIAHMISNPKLRDRISRAGQARAEEFAPRQIGGQFASAVRQLLHQIEARSRC